VPSCLEKEKMLDSGAHVFAHWEHRMKILSVISLALPDVKVVRFGRFCDSRGYFTEPFRRSDLFSHPELKKALQGVEFVQSNESFSRANVVRGLHFQWNPYQGKLVRPVVGHLIDLAMDIRHGSPTYGKIIAHDMPIARSGEVSEWIWLPPGFAHGTFFAEDTLIEYLCTGEYSQGCEAGISPLAPDLDWSLCDPKMHALFKQRVDAGALLSDKDRNGFTLAQWSADARSHNYEFTDELG
jgi:dTDP-4-dehydrorhamnose 3,5-epimerase